MLVVIDGTIRINLLNVSHLSDKDGKYVAIIQGGSSIEMNEAQYNALCKAWDSHAEHVKTTDQKEGELPTPPGQAEREFSLGE